MLRSNRDKWDFLRSGRIYRFTELPRAQRGRMLRNLALVFLVIGFLMVFLNPINDTPGMAVGIIGVAIYFYSLILIYRGRRD